MASNSVESVILEGSQQAIDLSITGLISQADPIVKIVILLLILSSFWSWAIIFDKWKKFRQTRYKVSKFEKLYRSTTTLNPLYEKLNKRTDNPMAAMFVSGMRILTNSNKNEEKLIRETVKERIFHSVQNTMNDAIGKMEKDLIFLATVGSSAPFVGLFGTVWGIMNSFQAIAATKNTTLAVVAPGIAEALLATAIGLFAAIPAVIFYNLFSNQIRVMSEKLEDYCSEISAILSHQIK